MRSNLDLDDHSKFNPRLTRSNVLETQQGVAFRQRQITFEALYERTAKRKDQAIQLIKRQSRAQEKEEKNQTRREHRNKAKRLAKQAGSYIQVDKAAKVLSAKTLPATILQKEVNQLQNKIETLTGTLFDLKNANALLVNEIKSLKADRESLLAINQVISEKKKPARLDQRSTLVKEILTKLCIDPQFQPTPEESLLCVTELYGDRVQVLASAWSSAKKLDYFVNGRRLLSLLMRLATSYIDSMLIGGDGLARQVFTQSEFSSRESDPVMSSKSHARKRMCLYQSQQLTMQRHLKIGVSTDTKLSIRVYFDYLPNEKRVVIGWCGEHLPIPGKTS